MSITRNISMTAIFALYGAYPTLGYTASPFELGVPANQTCAVLWDRESGLFSRDALARTGKVILRMPDTKDIRELLPDIAGKAVILDLDGLHNLPNGMTDEDTIILGDADDGGTVFAPYALYAGIVGCLPCPDMKTS